jgi:hypothetical protein
MIDLHYPAVPLSVGSDHFEIMSDQQPDSHWQRQRQQQQQQHTFYNNVPPLNDQWTCSNTHASNPQQAQQPAYGMAVITRSLYTDESYLPYTTTLDNTNTMLSPVPAFTPTESTWLSDMDVSTTPNFNSPEESMIAYPHNHLVLPNANPGSKHAHPRSMSPQQQPGQPAVDEIERPRMGQRANTAPAKSQRAHKAPASTAPGSDESDEDLVPDDLPTTKIAAKGGRKRQRIPHTAVERRYRENLNAHLDRLRQTVPSLASRRLPGAATGARSMEAATAEGAKPSKCEILNGAIEYITVLDRENNDLKTEVTGLRANVVELQKWYNAAMRSGGHFPE